jgi:hypothetical protein
MPEVAIDARAQIARTSRDMPMFGSTAETLLKVDGISDG